MENRKLVWAEYLNSKHNGIFVEFHVGKNLA